MTEPQFDKIHTVPEKLELGVLDARDSFNQLTQKEKLYSYFMYKASWAGSNIIAKQISHESCQLIKLFTSIFSDINVYALKTHYVECPSLVHFINYVASVFSNMGNYMSYGDTKIVPRMTRKEMDDIFKTYFNKYLSEYDKVADVIFSLSDKEKTLGYPLHATTTYFSDNFDDKDVKLVDAYVVYKKYEGWNTRATKETDPNIINKIIKNEPQQPQIKNLYVVHIASVGAPADKESFLETYEGEWFYTKYGDYSDELRNVALYLQRAQNYAANKNQEKMIDWYVDHFLGGDLNDHKMAQKCWVQDKNPVIETNIGFIEHYRDPSKIRAEFESFVAAVDKEKTKQFELLVENAEKFLALMPYDKSFEKEKFIPPNFTSLNILTFAASGIPAGIHLSNYNDISEMYGSKCVYLSNVIEVNFCNGVDLPKYLTKEDGTLYNKYVKKGFKVDVGCHELLGHGAGKLFTEKDVVNEVTGEQTKVYNFDKNTINPFTNEVITTWYKDGETFGSVFGGISGSYEESRAEAHGLFLNSFRDVHKIFGHTDEEWNDISYTSWLWMVRSGVIGMSAYDTQNKKWLQAHCCARFAIYKVLKEANVVNVVYHDNSFIINVNRHLIETNGMQALKEYIARLNVYKSTADFQNGSKYFNHYISVNEEDLKIREIYLKEKPSRTQYIQPSLVYDKGKISYVTYGNTAEDLITSFCDKF